MALHEVLGECFRGLDAGSVARRPERSDPAHREPVGKARRDRTFLAENDEIHPVVGSGGADSLEVGEIQREIASDFCRASVSGRDKEVGEPRRFTELPGQGVLAGARAHDEDVHGLRAKKARESNEAGQTAASNTQQLRKARPGRGKEPTIGYFTATVASRKLVA